MEAEFGLLLFVVRLIPGVAFLVELAARPFEDHGEGPAMAGG